MTTTRTRKRSSSNGGSGLATWNTSSRAYTPAGNYEETTDVVGNTKGDNPFQLTRRKLVRFQRINGGFVLFGHPAVFDNAVPSCVYTGIVFPPTTPSGDLAKLNSGISDGHPGSSGTSLPNFLYELKDVPGMLKHAGKRAFHLSKSLGHPPRRKVDDIMSTSKRRGEDWLNYSFGWVPFFSDLSSILDTQANVTKTHNMLREATRRGGYISRRANLGTTTIVDRDERFPFDNFQQNWFASAVTKTVTKRWVTTKWKTDPYPYSSVNNDDQTRALRLTLGADLSFENVWNAMPWSWLVDYFSDASDIINIHSNRFGIEFGGSCLMTHVVAVRTITPYKPPRGGEAGVCVAMAESKTRSLLSLSNLPTTAAQPLSSRQLGNLAALSVAKVR